MTYQTYEFTAFSEADLLSSGDSNLGCGDTFTMPGAATTCISVTDNDSYLSGDSYCNENSDDHYGQQASIDGVSGGQIYAESYFWVHDDAGNWYVMIEIEQEGGSGDYFTFYTGSGYTAPEAGTNLTVYSQCNVTSDWIDFNCLDAGEKVEPEPEGAICGRVTLDEDCDNTEFAEGGGYDEGLGGLTVELYGWDGSSSYLVDTTTTNADGSYDFPALEGGWYYVKFEKPEGTKFADQDVGVEHADSDADEWGYTDWICLGEDEVRLNVDASVKPETGSVSGTVFCDVDCDGINGTEVVVEGCDYTIEAEHMQQYGFHTVSGAEASADCLVKLNCAGGWGDLTTSFHGKDGTYDVTIWVQDENDGQSTIKLKVNGELVEAIRLDADTDGGGSNNGGFSAYVIKDVNLNDGDDITLWADGDGYEFVRIDKIDLEGQDTVTTTEEPTKAGVTIKLIDADTGEVVATTETDADGNYAFDGVPVGDYKIMGVAPNGTEFTIQDAGSNDNIDSDVDANGMSGVVTVTADGNVDVDLGVCEKPELGALSGRYFCDENDNSRDDGEPGIAGATVWLIKEGEGVIASTTTDSEGNYRFDDLEAGDYRVRFEDPNDVAGAEGKVFVDANVGDDIDDSDVTSVGGAGNGNTGTVSVVAGEETMNVDAGIEELLGSLSGRYFCDDNRDGQDNDGADNGVAGVTVELLNADGTGTGITTVTDADGNYSFGGLSAGTYGVKFTDAVSGKVLTTQNVGDDATDSDAADVGGGMSVINGITVVAGQDTPDNDAGVVEELGSLSGRYFCDDNRDGQDNDGADNGVEGILVELLDENGQPTGDSVRTDANGNYSFAGLVAGTYGVKFTDDNGVVSDKILTASNVGDDATDSDALGDNFMSSISSITVVAGQDTPDNDAGVYPNGAPVVTDDMGKGCADEDITVDFSDNYSDAETSASITMINGQNIAAGETITLANGVEVTLTSNDEFIFNGESTYAALDIGEEATESFTVKVEDTDGATSTASIDVTFCGDANSLESLVGSMPNSVTYQVTDDFKNTPIGEAAYDLLITGSGDARLDNIVFEQAYCLSFTDAVNGAGNFGIAPALTGDLSDGKDGSVFSASQVGIANGLSAEDNLDMINWILAQDFENNGAGSVNGAFNGWEVQLAIWELTDTLDPSVWNGANSASDFLFDVIGDPAFGQRDDVDFIVQQALANGEGFMAMDGDIASFIIDPNPSTAENAQPFIVAFDYDEYDCIC